MKYLKKFKEHFSKWPAFTSRDALLFLSELGASRAYSHLLLINVVKKGDVHKIKKGVYTFGDDPALASFAFSPSYHGLQDALSLLDLWDQETNTVLITPLRVRGGVREILGSKVFVRKIDRKMFFGFTSLKYFDYWIQVSDVEKTLIDFVYFKVPLQPIVLEEIKKRIDQDKLDGYLKQCSSRVKRGVRSLLG